ncbi:MAG: helix-turn-helix domain-containing protein, partial [Bryobacteraceae bacterium]
MRTANTPLMRQVEKIAASPILHGSDALCRLLRYLATEAIENPGTSTKEYRIATEVFGRSHEFDPKIDSTVRVQTGRLRSKLAEYYSTLGSRDAFLIEIPKGAYLLSFHARNELESGAPAAVAVAQVAAQPRIQTWMILSGAALAVVTAFVLLWARYATPAANWRTMLKAEGIQGADLTTLKHFWGGFCLDSDGPIVVYSNAEFIGRPESGMRYLQPSDPKDAILDHYTGVGEVMAMHDIDYVFSGLHSALRVKRGRLLTFDDAQSNDLIFVGSPSENLVLRDLPITQDFV